MEAIDQRLENAGVQGRLGVAEHERGMNDDASMLEGAGPFDREFIGMMIAHHQGAIRMAHARLDKGENAELTELARAIVDAQAKEIDQMNTWRVEWFGGVSPRAACRSRNTAAGRDTACDQPRGRGRHIAPTAARAARVLPEPDTTDGT